MNYKNLLQEHCQKNSLPLPNYSSFSRGEPHQLQWVSEVIVLGKTYASNLCATRKTADKQAAEFAYYDIMGMANSYNDVDPLINREEYTAVPQIPPPPRQQVRRIAQETKMKYTKAKTFIAVDLENVQPVFDHPVDANIHYFKSSYSTVAHEHFDGEIHIIDSGNSDAADHYMTFMTAIYTSHDPTMDVILVSRDKFSGVLYKILFDLGHNVTHVKSAKDLIDLLDLVKA